MGFASGFRTGLATGDRRSMMPIVQGLGSMIDRIQARNKRGSVRFGGSSGPSSYEKYTARKDQEEAAAEEKRRYETEQSQAKSREAMATQQAGVQEERAAAGAERAAAGEERAAETHASKMATEKQQRAKAAEMFTRSKKKEDRVEAYRGLLQGLASQNKALAEESWAALSPDMDEKDAGEMAEIKREPYIDPETGQPAVDPETGEPIMKFTVGRDKEGGESKGMPAPSMDFNEDGSVTVEFPTPEGVGNPVTYASVDEFVNKSGIKNMNPEFESKESLAAEGKKAKKGEDKLKFRLTRLDKKLARLEKRAENMDPDTVDAERKEITDEIDEIESQMQGKEAEGDTMMVAGQKIHAGENPPAGAPEDVERDPKGYWFRRNEKNQKIPLIVKK